MWELLRDLWSLDGPLPLTEPPSNKPDPVDAGASSPDIPTPSPSDALNEYYSELGQSFDPWNSMLTGDQSSPGSTQGMSIEQLLASDGNESNTMESVLDDELMSVWMAAPTDVVNIAQWDSFMENRNINGADVNWSSGFGI